MDYFFCLEYPSYIVLQNDSYIHQLAGIVIKILTKNRSTVCYVCMRTLDPVIHIRY